MLAVGATSPDSPLFCNFCNISLNSERISTTRSSIVYRLKVNMEQNLFLTGVVLNHRTDFFYKKIKFDP